MTRRWKAALLPIVVVAAVVLATGCRSRNDNARQIVPDAAATAGWSGRIVRSADTAIAEPTRPYFAAGLGLLVLGGLAAIAGARTAGLAVMALGGAVTAFGVLIVQYPWVVLLAFLAAAGAAGLAFFDRRRTEKELTGNRSALAAAAQVIQNLPEGKAIKRGLADLGKDVEEQVRQVIDPIKERLRREGKIGARAEAKSE